MAKTTVPAPPDTDHLDTPDRGAEPVAGGFGQDGMTSEQTGNDVAFVQPLNEQKLLSPAVSNESTQDMLSHLFESPAFVALVEREVSKRVAGSGDKRAGQQFVEASAQARPSVQPDFEFLKHYRNDASPELFIQELDMSAPNPKAAPIVGRGIRFRRGHFFATTQNQVDQIESMMNAPTHSADGTKVVGGVLGIYEDDGEQLYYCPAGCPIDRFQPTANKKKFQAHMRAVHQVEV